ncbi:unnamed protein product [Closterium sp. Naga37s-1]|nr:unnamed protein product [Closterium sp. Naga37s-1]
MGAGFGGECGALVVSAVSQVGVLVCGAAASGPVHCVPASLSPSMTHHPSLPSHPLTVVCGAAASGPGHCVPASLSPSMTHHPSLPSHPLTVVCGAAASGPGHCVPASLSPSMTHHPSLPSHPLTVCVARPPVDLAIVFLPLILLEGLVLVDNFRMCMALMPGEDDNMTDEALWETLPHFAVAVSMIFFMAATVFSVLKLNAGVIVFQVLLCMRLEGQPNWAAHMSYWMLFSPLIAVQLAALMSALTQLAEGVMLLYAPESGRRFSAVVREHDPFMFVTRGMRLAGWWWRDDEVREEQKSLTASLFPGTYDTFEAVPPDHIKRMRKGQLAEEVVRLQAALAEQVETGKAQRQELERVQQEKVLCRVCFEREISLVLLPCRHRVLCHPCADKCRQCPICRRHIADRMAVFDV